MTLNQLVKVIQNMGNNHKQIHTTHQGNLLDILAKSDLVYPVFSFNFLDAQITGVDMNVNFTMFFLDRILAEQTNETEVMSDQLLIAGDIIAQLKNHDQEYVLVSNVRLNFLKDTTPDLIGGVNASVTLSIPYLYNRCEVPL